MKRNKHLLVIFFVLFIFSVIRLNAEEVNEKKLQDKPNIIIITIDSLRADHLGCYGYYRDITPNIDKFSEEAVLFKDAISNGPSTHRSIPGVATAKFNINNLFIDLNNEYDDGREIAILNPNYPTLAQVLEKSGYVTYFISDFTPIFPIQGFSRGFDMFIQEGDNNPALLTQAALKWLTNNKELPFFMWIHYEGPHHPYSPNKAADITAPLKGKDKIIPFPKNRGEIYGVLRSSAQKEGEISLNYYRNNYDGKILMTDEQVGVFLKKIKQLGIYDDSLIILTADHGEEFGEHNFYTRHGHLLYYTLLRVPLIMKFPQNCFAGKIVNESVSLLDVAPTVLDVIKNKESGLDGETLLPIMNNSKKRNGEFIYSSAKFFNSVVWNKWQLIHNCFSPRLRHLILTFGGKVPKKIKDYELYNLADDPYEQKDLSESNIEIFNKLVKQLTQFEEEMNKNKIKMLQSFRGKHSHKSKDEAKKEAGVFNRTLPLFEAAPLENSKKEEELEAEKLRNLGYLQ